MKNTILNKTINTEILKSTKYRYKRISKESISFTNVYNKFISENKYEAKIDDYIYALKTHLLMVNYSSSKINSYINEIIKKINSSIKNELNKSIKEDIK